jgi:large-conductance mechanosensitive channel
MIKILLKIKNRFQHEEKKVEETKKEPEPSAETKILTEIREILKNK